MEKWCICNDTVCQGFQPTLNEDGSPVLFASEAEAQAEIDSDPEFYNSDDFPCRVDEIGRKTIFKGIRP